MENKIKLHGMYIYKCERCTHTRFMYLEKGVEGKDGEMPCPYTIACPVCGGDFSHSFWKFDVFFDKCIDIEEGNSYFKLDKKVGYGVPVFDYEKS